MENVNQQTHKEFVEEFTKKIDKFYGRLNIKPRVKKKLVREKDEQGKTD